MHATTHDGATGAGPTRRSRVLVGVAAIALTGALTAGCDGGAQSDEPVIEDLPRGGEPGPIEPDLPAEDPVAPAPGGGTDG